MRTNSRKKNREKTQLELSKKLEELNIEKHLIQSQFSKRKARKIVPKELIIGFFLMLFSPGKNSFSNWAAKIGFIIGQKLSKQGLWKRSDGKLIKLLKSILAEAIKKTLKSRAKPNMNKKLKKFKNILLQDSTSIKLNEKLYQYYPGNENGHKNKKSIMKIDSIYNLSKHLFSKLYISSFRRNDQSASSDILEVAKRGDLVIRDLGYFILDVFIKMSSRGINYISRLRLDVKVLDKQEENRLDLVKILKKKGQLDIDVLVGIDKKLPTRLIAIPLEESQAAQRRRRAKNNRDKRLNPGKDTLFLMGWSIFVTNLDRREFSCEDILQIYQLRWTIEIIFKSWKSHLGIKKMEELNNRIQVEIYIYCMLLFITLFQIIYYKELIDKTKKSKANKKISFISLLKFTEFINSNLIILLLSSVLKNYRNSKQLDEFLYYYCKYESRNKRTNFYEKLLCLS